MAELCHVCDLFRMALFGPTDNITEDHLDDGQGNDLPSPMADAPAKLAVRCVNQSRVVRFRMTELLLYFKAIDQNLIHRLPSYRRDTGTHPYKLDYAFTQDYKSGCLPLPNHFQVSYLSVT